MLRRKQKEEYRVTGFVDRLASYGKPNHRVVHVGVAEPELVERAATLLSVMPGNQRRETIERLLSPYDHDRGRRAIDDLIDTSVVVEDNRGRLRRVA